MAHKHSQVPQRGIIPFVPSVQFTVNVCWVLNVYCNVFPLEQSDQNTFSVKCDAHFSPTVRCASVFTEGNFFFQRCSLLLVKYVNVFCDANFTKKCFHYTVCTENSEMESNNKSHVAVMGVRNLHHYFGIQCFCLQASKQKITEVILSAQPPPSFPFWAPLLPQGHVISHQRPSPVLRSGAA